MSDETPDTATTEETPEVAWMTDETAAYLASQTVPPPGGWVERRPVTSRLTRVSVLARDETFRGRVRVALTIAGIYAVDEDHLIAAILARPLLESGPVADAVEVTEISNEWTLRYDWDAAAITDDMIEDALAELYRRRVELGVAVTGPEERA